MKRLIPLLVLAAAGCSGQTPPPAYVSADIARYEAFAPVVARDVKAGHEDTARLYQSWGVLVAAEKATTQPATK